MIDVLIQTHNEELNLPHTLASVQGWASNIFIVDSGSTDRTAEIAAEYGAQFTYHAWEGYAAQKNWALDNLPFQSDWILILDADEAVTPELRDEITQLLHRPSNAIPEAGFYINRVLIFMGREIRHSGYFPSWNLRLFKRGRARYENRLVHEHMLVDGPAGYLKHLMLHEDRRGFEHFFAKHNRYSSLEAREIYESPSPWPGLGEFFRNRIARRRFGKSRILPYLPVPWVWRLLYMYICRLGFLDGRAGWYLCNFIASYEFSIQLKYVEIKRLAGSRSPFEAAGLAEAEGHAAFTEHRAAGGSHAIIDGTRNGSEAPTWRRPRDNGIPTLYRGEDDVHRFLTPWTFRQNVVRALWMLVVRLLFRPSFHNWYGWRNLLLRCFGARIGRHVRVRPTAKIEIPWNIEIGDSSVIGDDAILYSLGRISIGQRVVISQYAHLCAGTHDHRDPTFPLLKPPIVVEDGAWIAADAFVGPGVTVHENAILGARASAFSDLPANMICVGNPARAVKEREVLETSQSDNAGGAPINEVTAI